jgi:hypothetical protein
MHLIVKVSVLACGYTFCPLGQNLGVQLSSLFGTTYVTKCQYIIVVPAVKMEDGRLFKNYSSKCTE